MTHELDQMQEYEDKSYEQDMEHGDYLGDIAREEPDAAIVCNCGEYMDYVCMNDEYFWMCRKCKRGEVT